MTNYNIREIIRTELNEIFDILLEQNLNVADLSLEKARNYMIKEFEKVGKDLYKELPNFDENYILLQKACRYALDIPRKEMPVIEPRDMDEFEDKIRNGFIDIFKPFAFRANYFPKDLLNKSKEESEEWLYLGMKDGNINDDKIPAKIHTVAAKDLLPLQSQIWLELLTKYTIQYGVPGKGSPAVSSTIIISQENYILDGHHRYGQVMLADPSIKMKVLDIPLKIDLLLKIGRTYGSAIGNPPNL